MTSLLARTLGAFLLLGCSAVPEGNPRTESPAACVPGAQVVCACPHAAQGLQVCSADGTKYSKCECGIGASSSGGAGGVDPSGGGGASGSGGAPDPTPMGDLAGGIRIHEVAIYQGVKVSLSLDDASITERNAPVVEGRPLLLRVSVLPDTSFSPRPLVAELELSSANPNLKSKTVTLDVNQASSDADLASTFNFSLAGDEVTADLTFSVSLHETAGTTIGAAVPGVRAPSAGELALGAKQSGLVRVKLVPFRYLYDGSGRLPDTSESQLKTYQDILFAMYPTSQVEVSLRDPVDYPSYVGPSSGWSSWLDTLCDVRLSDNVDSKVYYFGIIAPKTGWGSYGGGIAGLGYVPSASGNWGRCAVGLGFPEADPDGLIMAHEVGHTMGLPHAPCGTDGDWFPYDGAKIGVYGYSLVSQTLKDPSIYRDVMSYCDPQWISDYNFANLFERIRSVNQSYYTKSIEKNRYRKLLVDVDGSLSVGGSIELAEPPPGTPTAVRLVDRRGAIAQAIGTFVPMSEGQAGAIFFPEPDSQVVEVELDGFARLPLRPR